MYNICFTEILINIDMLHRNTDVFHRDIDLDFLTVLKIQTTLNSAKVF